MIDIPADLAEAVRDRYTLRRVLGKGGMATVYLAHDRKHLRDVAVKVLRPDLAASIGSDRFLKEIQIAARLTHPHILALHDSGEEQGFLYYVMPFIDGPSLRQRLIDERRMEPEEALEIAAPVADALCYAHRMGFFHRDIKPENILFSQGHPIVADFGIAKAVSTAGGANLTRTGFPLGTPGYMSPEQAAGLTDLDERTDVYSLAVVIYEMLVGDIPGMWPSEEAVRTGRFLEATPSHRSRLAQVGGKIEEALVRGLSIRYEERTAGPAQLMDELTGRAAPSPKKRKYSEEQVREIVKRAAEIEASNPTASGAMTIGGIEQIAKDVGIAPEIVRQAVDVVSAKPFATLPAIKTKRNWFIGGPTRIVFERTVDGEVPESEFPVMVDEIRRMLQNVGQVAQLGRSFSWSTIQGRGGVGRNLEVAVTVRTGRTRIIVQENLNNLIGGVWGGIGGGMGGGGLGPLMAFIVEGLNMRGPGIAMLIPMWLALTYSTARTSYHYATKAREKSLEELVDRLAALALELVVEQGMLPRPEQRRLIS